MRAAARASRAGTVLLAGAAPGSAAGNAVSSEVMRAALERRGPLAVLTHAVSLLPRYRRSNGSGGERVTLGTQPVLSIHGEALLPGWLHRRRLSDWSCAWVVNSRYAGAPMAAGVPYAIWEATTVRDELAASDPGETRRAGMGSGIGAHLHHLMLPAGERIEGALYRRAALLLAMSEHTREQMIATHGLRPDGVAVLTHPPSPSFLDALGRQPARSATRPRSRGLRLLFVGRVNDPRKNFGLLLAAMRTLRASAAASLTVVGPFPQSWRRRLASDVGSADVTFRGRVGLDELAGAYLEHDLLVVPSRQEGFGIVVAEAFHAGLPVVATRCGGPEAVIRQSGAGVLVGHDPVAMAGEIAALAWDQSRREDLARRALRYARDELSFDRFAERVATLTERLAGASGGVAA